MNTDATVLGPMVNRLCSCNYDGEWYLLPSAIAELADPHEHQPTCGYRRHVLGEALLTDERQIVAQPVANGVDGAAPGQEAEHEVGA